MVLAKTPSFVFDSILEIFFFILFPNFTMDCFEILEFQAFFS